MLDICWLSSTLPCGWWNFCDHWNAFSTMSVFCVRWALGIVTFSTKCNCDKCFTFHFYVFYRVTVPAQYVLATVSVCPSNSRIVAEWLSAVAHSPCVFWDRDCSFLLKIKWGQLGHPKEGWHKCIFYQYLIVSHLIIGTRNGVHGVWLMIWWFILVELVSHGVMQFLVLFEYPVH